MSKINGKNRDDFFQKNHLLPAPSAESIGDVKGAEQSGAFISTLDIASAGGYPLDAMKNGLRTRDELLKKCGNYPEK